MAALLAYWPAFVAGVAFGALVWTLGSALWGWARHRWTQRAWRKHRIAAVRVLHETNDHFARRN